MGNFQVTRVCKRYNKIKHNSEDTMMKHVENQPPGPVHDLVNVNLICYSLSFFAGLHKCLGMLIFTLAGFVLSFLPFFTG